MRTLHELHKIINARTLVVTALALLSTYLCRRFHLVADLPIDLIGLAVVFPLVFSITGAYRMREDALAAFAGLKGNAAGLFFAHRDWPEQGRNSTQQVRKLIAALFENLHGYFVAATPELQLVSQKRVFEVFAEFSLSIDRLRRLKLDPVEVARANEYLKEMVINFERMNNVARYRTPIALRAFTRVFLTLFPIIFGPHFANIGYPDTSLIGYIIAGLYAFVLVSLDNLEDHLENPFDGIGPDDLKLDIVDELLHLLDLEEPASAV